MELASPRVFLRRDDSAVATRRSGPVGCESETACAAGCPDAPEVPTRARPGFGWHRYRAFGRCSLPSRAVRKAASPPADRARPSPRFPSSRPAAETERVEFSDRIGKPLPRRGAGSERWHRRHWRVGSGRSRSARSGSAEGYRSRRHRRCACRGSPNHPDLPRRGVSNRVRARSTGSSPTAGIHTSWSTGPRIARCMSADPPDTREPSPRRAACCGSRGSYRQGRCPR